MTRTLYDSTVVADIPATAKMVAAYVDGRFRSVDEVHKRFPHATVVTITVLGTPGANVCDTEPGNIGVEGAAKWAANEVTAGRHPTLYCMASQWDEVKRHVAAHGVTGKVSYWIADYDGNPTVPTGAVAKQHLHGDKSRPGSYSGGHFDMSVVADYWPDVDPKPKPAPPKSYPLAVTTRAAVALLTRRMNHRRRPVNLAGRRVLTACRAAIDHALAIK